MGAGYKETTLIRFQLYVKELSNWNISVDFFQTLDRVFQLYVKELSNWNRRLSSRPGRIMGFNYMLKNWVTETDVFTFIHCQTPEVSIIC